MGCFGNLQGLFPKNFQKNFIKQKNCLFLRGRRSTLKSFKDTRSTIFYSNSVLSLSKNKAIAKRRKVKMLNKSPGKDTQSCSHPYNTNEKKKRERERCGLVK